MAVVAVLFDVSWSENELKILLCCSGRYLIITFTNSSVKPIHLHPCGSMRFTVEVQEEK